MISESVQAKTASYKMNTEKEKDWFQILAIFLACIACLTGGMLFSWPSPSIPKIVADKINYNITLEEASYFTVLPPLGAVLSSFGFSKLNDSIGRKYTLLLSCIPHIISLILISTTQSVYVFYIARVISGIADSCLFISLPAYVGEIATPKVRGSWGNFMSFFIYLGQFLINILGSYTSISMAGYIMLIFPIFFLCTFIFMPESPYFYLMKNRIEDARRSLRKLRRKQNVEDELQKLKLDVDRQMSESGTWKDLFTIQTNRKAIYAAIFIRASQQFGGISAFVVYNQYIFLKSGGDISASTSSIIFMGLCAFLNICASFTLDRFGRRKSYFVSLLTCGIILMCETIYFFLEQFYPNEINLNLVNWIPLAGMILYIIFYSFGLGIVPTLMLGELFSARIKGKGLLILNLVFAVLISSTTKLFNFLDITFGLFSAFLFFSVSCFLSTVLALHFVPETKGKTLEEIQQSLKKSKSQNHKDGC